MSFTPLFASSRSADTQYGQTAVLYINTFAMMISELSLSNCFKSFFQRHTGLLPGTDATRQRYHFGKTLLL